MIFSKKSEPGALSSPSTPPDSNSNSNSNSNEKRRSSSYDEGHVPWVTWRSLTLGAFVSIGGIIFGYDTGQISGFLEMKNYKQRYGQFRNGAWVFSNVRSGLIVSMVSFHIHQQRTRYMTLERRVGFLIA
jgi:SP family sugar:H+ symporter-like MFS transporter